MNSDSTDIDEAKKHMWLTVVWQHIRGGYRRTTYRRDFDAQSVTVKDGLLIVGLFDGAEVRIPFFEITEYSNPAVWPDTED